MAKHVSMWFVVTLSGYILTFCDLGRRVTHDITAQLR